MTQAQPSRGGFYERRGKRTFDFLTAGAVGLATLPLQLFVAALVRAKLGRPVVFRQTRPGLSGRPFEILKFRTMTDDVDGHGRALPDYMRLTPFGQMLRSTSLDELPELWNVVKGEMSLVGPRPLLVKYLPRYTSDQARRHDVRPGVTGWAQVNGRNSADWHEKLAMDIWYVDNVSILLDLKILVRTVSAVFRRQGIRAEGHATSPEFTGLEKARINAPTAVGLVSTRPPDPLNRKPNRPSGAPSMADPIRCTDRLVD